MTDPPEARCDPESGTQQGRRLWFLVPGDLETPTGGYGYDRRIIEGLRAQGWRVEHRTLDASFPQPTREALEQANSLLARIPDQETVVVDGLAYGAMPDCAESQGRRIHLIALVHHPLWLETGLEQTRAESLRLGEVRALAQARRIITTSSATARLLQGQGVEASRIQVVTPGVDRAPAAAGSPGSGVRLLCVATLTPRKGHDVLLRALADLAEHPWQLYCVGSSDRDPPWAGRIRRLRHDLGLEDRVSFTGALSDAELEGQYLQADLFVLPTRFEGYGMVAAEALARGLPVVATRTGALPDLVDPQTGILVPPGDPQTLGEALGRLLREPALRRHLAAGARRASSRLPTWTDAARAFAAACQQTPGGTAHG